MDREYQHIAILKFPGAHLAAIHGVTDMLVTANKFILEQNQNDQPLFCVTHWEFDEENKKLVPGYRSANEGGDKNTVLIVPGSMDPGTIENLPPAIVDWVRQQHAVGAITTSICKGAFILGRCGILENRHATTHWDLKDSFTEQFPAVNLKIDEIIVDEGDVITAGGVMAWTDLGLRLIHRLAGPKIMGDVSKYLLIDPNGRDQKIYRAFSPPLDHGDELVIKVQHFLQTKYNEHLILENIADMAATSVRTLIRRFHNALGMSPTTYIQLVRIGKARELLERTMIPVNQVSWKVGYEDPGSFRRIFKRSMGLSPAQYRNRFAAIWSPASP